MKRWTTDEENKLRELYATNKSGPQIAAEIGRPLRAVYVKAHKLGLPKKPDPHTITLYMEQTIWLNKARDPVIFCMLTILLLQVVLL